MKIYKLFLLGTFALFVSITTQQCGSTTNQNNQNNTNTTNTSNQNNTNTTNQNNQNNTNTTGTFACGDKTCNKGSQYCKPYSPGACIGSPVPDGGCPKYCQEYDCQDPPVCLCTSYGCEALPKNCNDCKCLKASISFGDSCTCTEKDGDITLNCPSA